MARVTHRRRIVLPGNSFHGKLIVGYFLFMLIGCLIVTIVLTLLSADSIAQLCQNDELQIGQSPFTLVKQLLAAHWVYMLVGSVFVVVAAMIVTHRLAGPMFRFEGAVDNMISGQLHDRIRLREKDEGQKLAMKLNVFNSELSENLRDMQRQSNNIDDLLIQYAALNPQSATSEDYDSIHGSMVKQNKLIQEIIAKYHC